MMDSLRIEIITGRVTFHSFRHYTTMFRFQELAPSGGGIDYRVVFLIFYLLLLPKMVVTVPVVTVKFSICGDGFDDEQS